MMAEQCAWSLLFTGTPGVYRGSGWQEFGSAYTEGTLAPPAAPGAFRVREATAEDAVEVAALHHAYNANRPLSSLRAPEDWAERVPAWYGPVDRSLVAEDPGSGALVGWMVAQHERECVEVREFAGVPGCLGELFAAVGERGRAAGLESGPGPDSRRPRGPGSTAGPAGGPPVGGRTRGHGAPAARHRRLGAGHGHGARRGPLVRRLLLTGTARLFPGGRGAVSNREGEYRTSHHGAAAAARPDCRGGPDEGERTAEAAGHLAARGQQEDGRRDTRHHDRQVRVQAHEHRGDERRNLIAPRVYERALVPLSTCNPS